MPKAPRGKRVADPATDSFRVVNKAPNGQAEPYFDRVRTVWVAPWRKADGRVGRPTGRTRALAEASRDRHIAKAAEAEAFGTLSNGFTADSTVAEVAVWWLRHVARHRVRPTSLATYRKRVDVISARLGSVPVRLLRPEQVATFVSDLADSGSPSRARDMRGLLVQVMDQAVELGLAKENVARKVKTPKVPSTVRRTITPDETHRLLAAAEERMVAAIALCFLQGWRISEALGLAWQDIDFDAGTVHVRRASSYVDGVGMTLGPTKTRHATAAQSLSPTVLELLRARLQMQERDRARLGGDWPTAEYEDQQIDLVFRSATGRPTLRQHVDAAIREAATRAGLDSKGLGTHAGRRSVVTNLFASGSLDLEDVARFVGHGDTATTRGYVQHEGDRPRRVSERAFELLDSEASRQRRPAADA